MIQPTDDQLRDLLARAKTIAVVGLSDKPQRPSRGVSAYMQRNGYRIIPVNPNVAEALGEKAYPSLEDVPEPIDLINVFRRSRYVAPLVDAALGTDASAFWTQIGVQDNRVAATLSDAGLLVVQNRCLMQEHMRLML